MPILTDGFKAGPPALFVLNEAERTLREVGGVLGILMEDPGPTSRRTGCGKRKRGG